MKITCRFIIIIFSSSFLILSFILCDYQSSESIKVQSSNETIYSKGRTQSYPQSNSLPLAIQNNKSDILIFSNPFYLSNATIMLAKVPIEKSSSINREVQFYVERGIINSTLVTYNVGYYVEDSPIDGSKPELKALSTDPKIKKSPNYAKGSGIFLTENGGIIEWDAFDQIIDKSNDSIHYTGMIFFSPVVADKKDELSLLKNRVGIYEFSIEADDSTKSPSPSDLSTSSSSVTTATPATPTTHRTIWLWPNTH
ncbi:MAG: hypothetical protein P0116_13670 [Candidatus Nitrosocosmicus sp.]|nr:hypothetical protein [Candidatus Nitrosocosmicus sp.]